MKGICISYVSRKYWSEVFFSIYVLQIFLFCGTYSNMKILTLSPKKLSNIINNSKYIGHGSNGLVVKLDENTLLKFKYKEFIDCFNHDDHSIHLDKLNDISKEVDLRKEINQFLYKDNNSNATIFVKLLIAKQPYIKYSTLTQGLVYVNGYCVGYLLQYHKNMVNLFEYNNKNDITVDERKIILKNIYKAMQELTKNGIYLRDFSTRNILYNPSTREIQIIDFEDSLICLKSKNRLYMQEMKDNFVKISKFLSKEKDNRSL